MPRRDGDVSAVKGAANVAAQLTKLADDEAISVLAFLQMARRTRHINESERRGS